MVEQELITINYYYCHNFIHCSVEQTTIDMPKSEFNSAVNYARF